MRLVLREELKWKSSPLVGWVWLRLSSLPRDELRMLHYAVFKQIRIRSGNAAAAGESRDPIIARLPFLQRRRSLRRFGSAPEFRLALWVCVVACNPRLVSL